MTIQESKNLNSSEQAPSFALSELRSPDDWLSASRVLLVLRPNLNSEEFLKDRPRLISEGYRLIGIKVLDQVVAVASYLIAPHPIYYREMLIHDMATLAEYQSQGCGSMLLAEIDRIAMEQCCGRCFVHSRSEREAAHKFYKGNGFEVYSLGFIKKYS